MSYGVILVIAALFLCFCGPVAVIRFVLGIVTLGGILLGVFWLLFSVYSPLKVTQEANTVAAPGNQAEFVEPSPTPYLIPPDGPGSSAARPFYVRSQEEYDKLPVGTWMTDSSGNGPLQKRSSAVAKPAPSQT